MVRSLQPSTSTLLDPSKGVDENEDKLLYKCHQHYERNGKMIYLFVKVNRHQVDNSEQPWKEFQKDENKNLKGGRHKLPKKVYKFITP